MYKIYFFKQKELLTEDFINQGLLLLPEDRRKKALCYRNPIDRDNCIITYLMLKIALKENFGITEFTMQYARRGKPYLVEYQNVFFSISHCASGCVVAVADELIGIDIQNIVPFSWDIAKRVCCLEKLNMLELSSYKTRDFIRMWTMKESFVKMTGEGIGVSLNNINALVVENIEVIDTENSIISICRRKLEG